MAIDPISSNIATAAQSGLQRSNNRLQAALASLVSGTKLNRASDDVAALSIASKLQSETAALRQVSSNLAQVASLSQVADGGAAQIQDALQKLKDLAQQANAPIVSEDNRKALNQQFQQLKAEIDRISENTSFNGKKLLDGSISGDNAISVNQTVAAEDAPSNDDEALSIPSLSTGSLFSGQSLDILSASGALQASAVIDEALSKVSTARADIGSFQQVANFAAANVDTIVANQQAAVSELSDTDFAAAASEASQARILREAALAIQAQGNRLSPALLKLIG
jgi:flagellin